MAGFPLIEQTVQALIDTFGRCLSGLDQSNYLRVAVTSLPYKKVDQMNKTRIDIMPENVHELAK